MTIVIKELDIEEFRGVRKLAKPIKLKKFNIIIGRNNTGKTTILEALYLLATPSGYTAPLTEVSRLDFITQLHGGKSCLIYGYSGTARIRYRLFNDEVVTVTLTAGTLESIVINNREAYVETYIDYIAKLLNISKDEVHNLTLYIPNSTEFLKELRNKLKEPTTWSTLTKYGAHRKIVTELINPTVYDKYTEILIERNELKLRKEVSEEIGPLYIHVADLGDGIERICLTALALEYLKPRLVLWDDMEVAAHPGLIEVVMKWLTSKNWQVVITTHSIDVLLELTYQSPEDSQVIILRKTPDDIVEHTTLTPNELEEYFNRGIDIRKLIDLLEL